MPIETLTPNGRAVSESTLPATPATEDDELRAFAIRHLEHVRRFKIYVATYVLSLLVLTPIWVATQYATADGWPQHLSSRSRYPGDWDPWLIWVALVGAGLLTIAALRTFYFDRPTTEAEIEREIERARSR
jgi:hypothetical protein